MKSLLRWSNAIVLVGAHFRQLGLDDGQPVAVLLGLADEVGDLPLEPVEAVVQGAHRRLRRRWLVRKARGRRRLSSREHLPLNLPKLVLEPFDALLGADDALRLRRCDPDGEQRRSGDGES